MTVLDPIDVRFYQLIWRPAQAMHKAWWEKLALQAWQPMYEASPRSRRWIDNAIAARRGFPQHGTAYTLTPAERQLLQFAERLPALLLALGLLRLGRAEYWMLKPYRETLQQTLDSIACAQLGVFAAASPPVGFHVKAPLLEATQVTATAQQHGMTLLKAALPDSAVLRAIEILFAPQPSEEQPTIEQSVSAYGLNLLLRLARFL